MGRTLLCSLAGAGAGFLAGFVVVGLAAGAQPASDTGPATLIVGVFLAGTGSIAGAIIGGVADLRELFRSKDQAQSGVQDRHKSE
jgi:hypothetical protein